MYLDRIECILIIYTCVLKFVNFSNNNNNLRVGIYYSHIIYRYISIMIIFTISRMVDGKILCVTWKYMKLQWSADGPSWTVHYNFKHYNSARGEGRLVSRYATPIDWSAIVGRMMCIIIICKIWDTIIIYIRAPLISEDGDNN